MCIRDRPQGVYGLKANFNHRFGDAEDYASLMVRYPEAVSILEGTWNTISSGYPSGPIVWGEKGALIVENGGDHGIHANVCVYLDRYSTTPSKVYCSDDYPLPEGRSNLAQEVFHHLETGEPVHYTMAVSYTHLGKKLMIYLLHDHIAGTQPVFRTVFSSVPDNLPTTLLQAAETARERGFTGTVIPNNPNNSVCGNFTIHDM